MPLKTLFAVPIAIILLVTLSLAGMALNEGWSGRMQGKDAVEAVEQLLLLQNLQSDLRAERVASSSALGTAWPTPELVRQRLAETRRNTDRDIAAIAGQPTATVAYDANGDPPLAYLSAVRTRLAAARAWIDGLQESSPPLRGFARLNEAMPRLLAVSEALYEPANRARLVVTAADPALSGLVIEDRLTTLLRDQLGLIAAVLRPRANAGERPDAAELGRVRGFLARAPRNRFARRWPVWQRSMFRGCCARSMRRPRTPPHRCCPNRSWSPGPNRSTRCATRLSIRYWNGLPRGGTPGTDGSISS
jgi:hypothetical protein